MPTKKTKSGREYEISGKKFSWFPLDDDDKPASEAVVIPLRLKLKTVLATVDREMDAKWMAELLAEIAPGHAEVIEDMDLNDFQEMFVTWQAEYEALSGASLGESTA